MVCSNAMKNKKQKKGLNMITEISWISPSILCTFFPTFVTKKVTASSKTIFGSQNSNCHTKPTRYFSTPKTTIFDFLRLALEAQNLEVHSGAYRQPIHL